MSDISGAASVILIVRRRYPLPVNEVHETHSKDATNMTLIARAVLILGFLAILAFCVFGFLASYEYAEPSRRLPWQLGYGTGGAVCLFAAVLLWRFRRPAPQPEQKERNE